MKKLILLMVASIFYTTTLSAEIVIKDLGRSGKGSTVVTGIELSANYIYLSGNIGNLIEGSYSNPKPNDSPYDYGTCSLYKSKINEYNLSMIELLNFLNKELDNENKVILINCDDVRNKSANETPLFRILKENNNSKYIDELSKEALKRFRNSK